MVTVLDYDERRQLVPADKPTAVAFPEDQPDLFLDHRLHGWDRVREEANVGVHTEWCCLLLSQYRPTSTRGDQKQVSPSKTLCDRLPNLIQKFLLLSFSSSSYLGSSPCGISHIHSRGPVEPKCPYLTPQVTKGTNFHCPI